MRRSDGLEQGPAAQNSGNLPSVGVIIPNHSRVGTLLETLESVYAQDYTGPIGIYLVYRQRPEMTEVLPHLRSGVVAIPTTRAHLGAKRNVGLGATSEDLIAFTDDDDIWHPTKIRRQVEALTKSAAVACCTSCVSFSRPTFQWPPPPTAELMHPVSEREIAFSSTIAVSSMICRGELTRKLQFTELAAWLGVEDLHLWLRIRAYGEIVCLERRLTAIRIDRGSVSNRGQATQELRALNVIADWRRRGAGTVALAALIRRTIDSAIARPGHDIDNDLQLLRMTYDGSLVGRRADALIVALVTASWRSRAIPATLRWFRRQERRLRSVMLPRARSWSADEGARDIQWGSGD